MNRKTIWHNATEEPQPNVPLLGEDIDGYAIYRWVQQESAWNIFAANSTLIKWCYISDIEEL